MDDETPSRPADVAAVRRRMLADMLAGVQGDDLKAVIATGDLDAITAKVIEKAEQGDTAAARWVMEASGVLPPPPMGRDQ